MKKIEDGLVIKDYWNFEFNYCYLMIYIHKGQNKVCLLKKSLNLISDFRMCVFKRIH